MSSLRHNPQAIWKGTTQKTVSIVPTNAVLVLPGVTGIGTLSNLLALASVVRMAPQSLIATIFNQLFLFGHSSWTVGIEHVYCFA